MRGCSEVGRPPRSRAAGGEAGAALAVGLLLVLVLTVLAVLAARGARLGLERARAVVASIDAFEAAERGLGVALASTVPSTAAVRVAEGAAPAGPAGAAFRYRVDFDPAQGETQPPAGFSVGDGAAFRAFHFEATATGVSAAERLTLRQDYYVVGPADE